MIEDETHTMQKLEHSMTGSFYSGYAWDVSMELNRTHE